MGIPLATYLLKVYLDALPGGAVRGRADRRRRRPARLPDGRPAAAQARARDRRGVLGARCWNEFLLALLYIQDDALKTIPTGLLAFSTRYVTDYGLLFSALSIVTLPMIAIYIVFNRQITEGITAGSLK